MGSILYGYLQNYNVCNYTHIVSIYFLREKMSSFSPLATILNQNKLTGPNYVDWKRNLDIVLTAKEHKYVLTQPCPDFPNPDTSLDERNRYNRCINLMIWLSAILWLLSSMFYNIRCRI